MFFQRLFPAPRVLIGVSPHAVRRGAFLVRTFASNAGRLGVAALLLFALFSVAPVVHAGGSLALSDLDVRQVQSAEGPLSDMEQSRTENGVVLGPGQSFWVDLKSDAESLTATVQAMPGNHGSPVRCRFATGTYIWEVTVAEGAEPIDVQVPLAGQELLVVEVFPTDETKPGVNVHVSPSSIVSKDQRPQAWGGFAPVRMASAAWRVKVDGRSGGITELSHPQDRLKMQWLRPAASWGTGWATLHGVRHSWQRPKSMRATGTNALETVYDAGPLRIRVHRHLDASDETLVETYTFENQGREALTLAEGDLGVVLPLFDSYPGADLCLTQRCHVHVWAGGASSYVNAMRMGGAAPHLGLVLEDGNLSSYSIHNRVQHSNDRGQFVVHPGALHLNPGAHYTLRWRAFWHRGWEDFFQKAARAPAFVKLEAERYTVEQGGMLNVRATSGVSLEGARLSINGKEWPVRAQGGRLDAIIPVSEPGEESVTLRLNGAESHLKAFVTPPPLDLIRRRVGFILRQQQKQAPGDRLDGAYLVFDNEKQSQVYDAGFPDHNAGRERLGMGVLGALYWPHCDDPALRAQLERSLRAYAAFVERELQNLRGDVFNDAGRSGPVRMYNYPWVIHFHLAMYRAFGDAAHLRRALETTRVYYARGGEKFYCIGMPVLELANALSRAGWHNERKEALSLFRKHADTILAVGTSYPKHEVNYEQSIVGPAAQVLLEVFLATREARYLDGAREQLKLLELFNGHQPDYHLNEIAIRHWDGYWFGGRKTYGDTFPHYWSTITGHVFALYAAATGDATYRSRASKNVMNNLCAFTAQGEGSAAYLYPLTINGKPGKFFDPWANDQDWALVTWLQFFGPAPLLPKEAPSGTSLH